MAQVNLGGSIAPARDFEIYNQDEDFTTSTAYQVCLRIDALNIRESAILLKNDDGAIDMDYKIFASAKKAINLATADPEVDDEWINLLSPAAYVHTTSKALDANLRVFETFSNPWRWVLVMIKADSSSPTLKIWHRGEN